LNNNLKYYIILVGLIFVSCASKKELKTNEKANNKKEPYTLIEDASPFYPLSQSIADIQNEIIDLKSQIIEYETKLHYPSVNTELLKMVTTPHLKHEITMSNGTIIDGTIIFEDADKMILKTKIGQLTLEKEFIDNIQEKAPMQPFVEFTDKEIEERINDDNSITYVGEVINNGLRRADFVRVIYNFWADDTSPIYSDSIFVSGQNIIYLNGVISDTSVEPTQKGNFKITIQIPDSLSYEYLTKDIRWNTFE
tara:strand:+ start:2338 stop:3093 length:756 start_codon:yes stop_codon:yes gene_type:complete